jgi:hypothetical protein
VYDDYYVVRYEYSTRTLLPVEPFDIVMTRVIIVPLGMFSYRYRYGKPKDKAYLGSEAEPERQRARGPSRESQRALV